MSESERFEVARRAAKWAADEAGRLEQERDAAVEQANAAATNE